MTPTITESCSEMDVFLWTKKWTFLWSQRHLTHIDEHVREWSADLGQRSGPNCWPLPDSLIPSRQHLPRTQPTQPQPCQLCVLGAHAERMEKKKKGNKIKCQFLTDRSPHILYPATANAALLNHNHRNSLSPTKFLLCLNQTLTLTAGDRETICFCSNLRPNHTHTSKAKNFTFQKIPHVVLNLFN